MIVLNYLKLTVIIFALGFPLSVLADNHLVTKAKRDVIYLWPGDVPGETEPKHEPEKDYDNSGRVRL
ncbi:MAG: hypothetical protein J7L96_08120 [Bacteroidales bacterium]|nr:hypothetical protein [Bacteroidales bacterium]